MMRAEAAAAAGLIGLACFAAAVVLLRKAFQRDIREHR
jgi:hypothetical protein